MYSRFAAFFLAASVLSGCHLIFPFEAASPTDSNSDAINDGGTDLMAEGLRPDTKIDGILKPDSMQPDNQLPDMTLPDTLQPDTLQPDALQPDSKVPCVPNPCLNGGTCSVGTGGIEVCTCANANWNPATKCADCKIGWYKPANCLMCAPCYSGATCSPTTATAPNDPTINCINGTTGNCMVNKTVQVTTNFTHMVAYATSFKMIAGTSGPGTISPTSGTLKCTDTSMVLNWTLPSGWASIELKITFTGFDGSTINRYLLITMSN